MTEGKEDCEIKLRKIRKKSIFEIKDRIRKKRKNKNKIKRKKGSRN